MDSQEQMIFDLLDQDLHGIDDFHSEEDEQLLSLLEEILSEVFQAEDDPESLAAISGNAIYDLSDEREVCNREKYEALYLNEGSPEIDDLVTLEEAAQEHFRNPRQFPMDENDLKQSFLTGFVQIYIGEKFDSHGKMVGYWKSTNKKVQINTSDLMDPPRILAFIESNGVKLSSVVRCVFYGPGLVEVIGSRIYGPKQAKEFLPLTDEHSNILLALPSYEDEQDSESIFEWVDQQYQDGIIHGNLPDVSRSTSGHWELTHCRLQEIAEEELENRSTLQFSSREKAYVAKQNVFIEKYSEARSLISSLNGNNPDINLIYSADTRVLEEVLFLSNKLNERIEDSFVYMQIKSLVTKSKILQLQASDSSALLTIQKINQNQHVDLHLIGLAELTNIMEILWSNCGIRIIESKKQVYFELKDRLRVLRLSAKSSFASK